jgi:hypothetical protein
MKNKRDLFLEKELNILINKKNEFEDNLIKLIKRNLRIYIENNLRINKGNTKELKKYVKYLEELTKI